MDSDDNAILSMTLTSSDDQLVVGSSSGDLSVVCCVTGDVLSTARQAHGAGVTAVVVNTATTVLASGTCLFDERDPNNVELQAA